MSEQPTNLQEAPECPTDDEVLAKRDAEIARLRTALTKADTLLGDTLDSDFGMWSRNDVSNLRRPVWAAYQLVHDALAKPSLDKPSRVGDGIAAPTLFGFRVVESYDVPDDEIWMRAQTRVKIVRLLDLDKPDPLSQALNEGDGTYRP